MAVDIGEFFFIDQQDHTDISKNIGGHSQVLPVAELPSDFHGEPEDGLQYLFLVRQQALNSPSVARAENPFVIVSPGKGKARAIPNESKPSEEWRHEFIKNFKLLRAAMRDAPSPAVLEDYFYPFPQTEESSWRSYIYGKSRKSTSVTTEESGSQSQIRIDERKYLFKDVSSDLLQTIDPGTITAILSFFAEWIQDRLTPPSTSFIPRQAKAKALPKSGTGVEILPERDAKWLLGLLSVTDDLLAGEDIHKLRNLAKICLEVNRHLLKQNSPQAQQQIPNCWMVVAIVSDIHGQRDLWDDR